MSFIVYIYIYEFLSSKLKIIGRKFQITISSEIIFFCSTNKMQIETNIMVKIIISSGDNIIIFLRSETPVLWLPHAKS